MEERGNPMLILNNQQLFERYRFNRAGIEFLEQLIGDQIRPATQRHNSLSAVEKILLTLRFLATGGIQLNDGDIHQVSQPSVCRAITQVVRVLSSPDIVQRFVHFPVTEAELSDNCRQFFEIAGFPKVCAVIDGTQIRIKAPSIDEDSFVNRKGFHSVNVQIAFDAYDRVVDVVARWPGSTHDSRILANSGLFRLFEEGHIGGTYHILGDSGYACRRWLLTPYNAPEGQAQTDYNRAHRITRSKVERGIGQLKRRFSVLHGEIRMKPEKVCWIVRACAVLHNICKSLQIPAPDAEDNGEEQVGLQAAEAGPAPQVGLRYRDHFANTHF